MSALNGLSKPYFQPRKRDSTGRFIVVSAWRPGTNTSAISPCSTKTATWPGRTMSCAPFLISSRGARRETSMICELLKEKMLQSAADQRIVGGVEPGPGQRDAHARHAVRQLLQARGRLGHVMGLLLAQLLQAARIDEGERTAQFARLEPHAVPLAGVDHDPRPVREVRSIHDLLANRAGDVPYLRRRRRLRRVGAADQVDDCSTLLTARAERREGFGLHPVRRARRTFVHRGRSDAHDVHRTVAS